MADLAFGAPPDGDLSAQALAGALARGVVSLHEKISNEGWTVRQDATLPEDVRRALAKLSQACLSSRHVADLGASIHVFTDFACRPFSSWGLSTFDPPFPFADVTLIDEDLSCPTSDCWELARQWRSELASLEELQFEHLRAALSGYRPAQKRPAVYANLREFLVRNPVVEQRALYRFIEKPEHISLAATINGFYGAIPQAAVHSDGKAWRCAHCDGLLWPDRDVASFPYGRCRISACRAAHRHSARGVAIEDIRTWRMAQRECLAFWVGPGLAEVRLFDALKAKGLDVALYPREDAADISVGDLAVGIDVKTYACPLLLAARLSRGIGRLSLFKRKIIVIPDDRAHSSPDYLDLLRSAYKGVQNLEFSYLSEVEGGF